MQLGIAGWEGGIADMLFTSQNVRTDLEARRWIQELLNEHCQEPVVFSEDPRIEQRINLTLPAWAVPLERERLQIDRAFTALSKEFSPSGCSLVVTVPTEAAELVIGFQWPDSQRFLRGKVRHLAPLGVGYYQIGLKVVDVLLIDRWPDLSRLPF